MVFLSRRTLVALLLVAHIFTQPLASVAWAMSSPSAAVSDPVPPIEVVHIRSDGVSDLVVSETISATFAITSTVSPLPQLSLRPLKMRMPVSAASLSLTRTNVINQLAVTTLITPSLSEVLKQYPSVQAGSLFQVFPSPLMTIEHNLSTLTPITQSYEFTPDARFYASPLLDSTIHDENGEVINPPGTSASTSGQSVTPIEENDRIRTSYIKESTAACNELLSGLDLNALVSLEVFWDQSLSSEGINLFLSEHPDLKPLMMIYQWEDHTAWYPFSLSKNTAENIQNFQQWQGKFLATSIADTVDALAETPDIWRTGAIRGARESLLQELQVQRTQLSTRGLQIAGMRAIGSAGGITQVAADATVDHLQQCQSVMDLQQIPSAEPEGRMQDDMTVRSAASDSGAYDDDTVWRPDYGRTWIADDEYIRSEFLWTNSSGINAIHNAYEHDIWVVEKDYLKCTNEAWMPYTLVGLVGAMTSVDECLGPAATNLPGAYLDTRSSTTVSPDAYESYAIGSAWGLSIKDNTFYYVHIDVDVENSARQSSQIRTQPQLSHWAGNWSQSNPSPTQEELFCGMYLEYMGDYPACVFSSDTWPAPGAVAFTAQRWSSMAPQYWGGPPSPPILVSPQGESVVNGTSISFEWMRVIADSYHLMVATDSSFNNRIFDQNIGNYIGISLNGFPDNGTQYWWRVVANNQYGSVLSDSHSFINGPSAPPSTPSLSSPGNGANATGSQVSFQWNSAARATDYHLQLALDSGFNDISFDSPLGGNYSGIDLSGMPDNGTEFWWRIKAGNSRGWSNWSTAWHFTNVPSASPVTPNLDSPVNGSNVAASDITFRWNPTARASTYQFQLSLTSDFNNDNLLIDSEVSYPYIGIVINGLPDNGWEFWWRVKATNSVGSSGWSSGWRFVNGPSASPATPGLDTPNDGTNTAQTEITFRWSPAPRARDYQFQLAMSNDFSADNLLVDANVSYPYVGIVISGLPDNGWEFWWRVKASNSKGNSGWSVARRFINGPSAAPTTPSLDSPGNGENRAETEVTFRWQPIARAQSYQFQLSLVNDFSADNLLIDTAISYPYVGIIINGLPDNGWVFWWRVQAGNSVGSSGWSASRSFVNGPSASPDVPTLSIPLDGDNAGQTEMTFRWEPTLRAVKYHYQLALTNDFSADGLLIDSEVSYPYVGIIINGLPDNGWDLYWRVKAGNDKGWGSWSTAWRVTNGPSALPEPPGLLMPADGGNIAGPLVEFRWTMGLRSASLRLQLAVDSAFQQVVFDQDLGYYNGVNLTGFSDRGEQFWWRVQSRNALGVSVWSEPRYFINGPGERSQLQGIVYDGATPLSWAVVSIGAKAAMSDENGRYNLRNIPAGSQQITAQRQGFTSASQELILAEGESITVNFSLASDGTQAEIDVSPPSLVFTDTSSVPLPAIAESTGLSFPETVSQSIVDIVSNQFVIGYKPGFRSLEIEQSIARLQEPNRKTYATRLVKSRLHSGTGVEGRSVQTSLDYAVVEVDGDSTRFLLDTRQRPEVAFVQPRRYARAFEDPNDPFYSLQHALPRVQLPGAWERGPGSVRPLVAIVDTGIDYTHPDLAVSFGSVKGYDFVDGDNDPRPDAIWESHGTHVAGIVAASRNDNVGVAGAAPVTLLSARALDENGTGTQDDVADAINWAVLQGARIVNLSLGGGADPILEAAVQNAWNKGVLLVAASGNSSQGVVSYPAAYPQVIAVGALNQANELASFSSYGSQQELVAPGTTILSTYPDNDYAVASGTSMATPLVTGVAALVLAHAPNFTNQQLRTTLDTSADDLGVAGRDRTYGYGRVNALAALDQVLGPRNSQRLIVHNSGQRVLEVSDIIEQSDWLSATPRAFTVWPGTAQVVNVIVDSNTLAATLYTDTLTILSNDTTDPSVGVEVSLAVESATISFAIPLTSGWNLVSMPIRPAERSVEYVLDSLSGEFDLVYGYDGCDSSNPWKSYDPAAATFANDLTEIDETTGHWIRSTVESSLLITGTTSNPAIPLCTGWNLVGYPSLHNLPVVEAMSSIAGCVVKVYAYAASDLTDPWKKYDPNAPVYANDLLDMTPGQGYWIQANQNCTWDMGD
jgi:hypothetical protein